MVSQFTTIGGDETRIRPVENRADTVCAFSDIPDGVWNFDELNLLNGVEQMALVSNFADGVCKISQPKQDTRTL